MQVFVTLAVGSVFVVAMPLASFAFLAPATVPGAVSFRWFLLIVGIISALVVRRNERERA